MMPTAAAAAAVADDNPRSAAPSPATPRTSVSTSTLLKWIYDTDNDNDNDDDDDYHASALTANSMTEYNQRQLEHLLIHFPEEQVPVGYRTREDNGCTALHYAAALNNVRIVQYLLNDVGCDINALNKSKSTPLVSCQLLGHRLSICVCSTLLDL